LTFDAQAWIAAHQPPSYKAKDGKEHVGRLWSHLEYLKWLKLFKTWLTDKDRSEEQYEKELRELIGSMGFQDTVVDEMVALPSVALEEMLTGFFALQRSKGDPSVSDSSTPAPPLPSSSSLKIEQSSQPSAS